MKKKKKKKSQLEVMAKQEEQAKRILPFLPFPGSLSPPRGKGIEAILGRAWEGDLSVPAVVLAALPKPIVPVVPGPECPCWDLASLLPQLCELTSILDEAE